MTHTNSEWAERFSTEFEEEGGHFGWKDIYPNDVKSFISKLLLSQKEEMVKRDAEIIEELISRRQFARPNVQNALTKVINLIQSKE